MCKQNNLVTIMEIIMEQITSAQNNKIKNANKLKKNEIEIKQDKHLLKAFILLTKHTIAAS